MLPTSSSFAENSFPSIAVAFPIADELSLDAPTISKQLGLTLADLVLLNRVSIEKLCSILIELKESGFALKVILETANSLISIVCSQYSLILDADSQDNGKAFVDKIGFREVANERDTKNFETFAKKYVCYSLLLTIHSHFLAAINGCSFLDFDHIYFCSINKINCLVQQ
jgi:hypothetical protein